MKFAPAFAGAKTHFAVRFLEIPKNPESKSTIEAKTSLKNLQ